MKKGLSILAGTVLAAAMMIVAPATVKAEGMPCTEATLQQFQANLAVAKQELAQAQAAKAQADANVVALRAQGVEGLQLLQATDAATNAANIVNAYQYKVTLAEQSVGNIASRGATEQYYLDMEAKWKNRANLDSIKTQLEGQNQITSAALEQLRMLQGELAKQQNNAASNPALAANVTAMQAQVAAAEAAYNAAQAKSNELAAQYAQIAGVPNWATDADNAAYDAFVRNYATSLKKPYTYTTKNEKGEDVEKTVHYYDGYNQNSTLVLYEGFKPNEWAIRWFE